jgi:hypothetical protein
MDAGLFFAVMEDGKSNGEWKWYHSTIREA